MASVKMTFVVEVDDNQILQHQIEVQSEKRSYFSQERKLSKEIVDKMNSFYSERWIDAMPWIDSNFNEQQ